MPDFCAIKIVDLSIESPYGNTLEEIHKNLAANKVILAKEHKFLDFSRSPLGLVEWDLDPERFPILKKLHKQANTLSRLLAKHCSKLLGANSILEAYKPSKIGFFLGTSTFLGVENINPNFGIQKEKFWNETKNYLASWQSPSVAMEQGLSVFPNFGFAMCLTSACSSSAWAFAQGAEALNAHLIDVAIVGGIEVLSEIPIMGFQSLQIVDPESTKPFMPERAGINLSEGAAIFMMVREDDKNFAGSKREFGKLKGWGSSCDGYHMVNPDPSGKGMALSMERALENSKININDLSYLNAHGTGTIANDAAELNAIKMLTNNRPLNGAAESSKSFHGHALGAAGAIEASITLARLLHGTESIEHKSNSLLLEVAPLKNQKSRPLFGLSNSFGFGGNNVTLIFERTQKDA